jgi:hypothetical protein
MICSRMTIERLYGCRYPTYNMLAPYLDFQISVSIETLVKGVAKPEAIVCVSFHSHTCRPNHVQTTLLDCLGTTKGQKS